MATFPAPFAVVRAVLLAVVAATAATAACGGNGGPPAARPTAGPSSTAPAGEGVIDPGDGGKYVATLEPADAVDVIDNPYFPLAVGSMWRYVGQSDGEVEVVEVTVTKDREPIMGISAVVVRDTVTIGGELVEDTLDWFVQDRAGNVWYLGEDVKDYENGAVVSTAGSWRAGVDGAQPGIVMPADPKIGDVHRQEYAPGEAEDMMEIIAVDAELNTYTGTYDDVVRARDWTPLEPGTIEEKSYARGVGLLRAETVAGGESFVDLMLFDPGP